MSGARGEVEIVEPTQAERALARRVAESRATIPDLELGVEVTMDTAIALAAERRVSRAAVLVRACALALRDSPRANAAYRDGRFELYSRINVAVVLSAQATPTVFDAESKSLEQLDAELQTLAARAERAELTPPELSGATFTLSDLGALGIDRPAIVVTGAQAAAVAAGSVRELPVVRDGAIVAGQIMQLTLAADSRILFGATAASFVTRIKQLLELGTL
jgi:pyruvate dehydrogenase E2 component (dihydrolipoamide acetyltransferase)